MEVMHRAIFFTREILLEYQDVTDKSSDHQKKILNHQTNSQ